jgi:phage terminase Nu1 subunit (DNA packaging protein)
MIEFTEDTVGIWFVGLPDSDWLASIFMENGKPCLVYRFRYHVDDKSFDSKDQKNWYRMEPNEGEAGDVAKLVEVVRSIAGLMAVRGDSEVYEIMMENFADVGAFLEEFKKAPFVSIEEERLH